MNPTNPGPDNSKNAHNEDSGLSQEVIREQLSRILASHEFKAKERLKRFLRFVVEETLAGRDGQINGTQIALTVLDRDETFDPQTDPVVRVQAGRLRRSLQQYYLLEGREDPVQIEIPKGGYVPSFKRFDPVSDDTSPGDTPLPALALHDLEEILSSGPSIAVLPFRNIGSEKEDDYLADGITEELIVALSRFQGFRVVARHSVMKFREPAAGVGEIGRALGVRYILEGSVRKQSNKLRMSAQLTDAVSGQCLWTDTYDADLSVSEVFAMQEEIARRVTVMIADHYGVILRRLTKESKRKPPDKLGVYDAILRFYHYNWRWTLEAFHQARAALEIAVQTDPDYALAWALLSDMYCDDLMFSFTETADKLDKAFAYARRAVDLDPMCQHARLAMAYVHFHRRDKAASLNELEQVIALNPNSSMMIALAGLFMSLMGEWDRGLSIMAEGLKFNPHYPGWFHIPTYLHSYQLGNYAAALAETQQMEMPHFYLPPLLRAAALGQLGRDKEGRAALTESFRIHPEVAGRVRRTLQLFVHADELLDRLVEGLRKAGMKTPE